MILEKSILIYFPHTEAIDDNKNKFFCLFVCLFALCFVFIKLSNNLVLWTIIQLLISKL